MGTMIRNIVVGVFMLGVVLTLFLNFDSSLKETYNYADSQGENASSFVSSDTGTNIIKETSLIADNLKKITVSASLGDIVGALMAVSTGAVNSLLGFMDLPRAFLNMFVDDYNLSKQLVEYSITLITIVFSFILLSAKLRNEV